MALLVALLFALAPQAPAARVVVEPGAPSLGTPVDLVLEVEHAADAVVRLPADAGELDHPWVLFESHGMRTQDDPATGRAVTRARWTAAAIEAGTVELPPIAFELRRPGAEGFERMSTGSGTVEVSGVLRPDETEPRPPRDFRDLTAPEPVSPLPALLGAAVAFLAAGLLYLWFRRRRSGSRAAERAATPAERLAALSAAAPETPDEVRAVHYDVTRALRAIVDERLGVPRPGLTDSEWAGAVAPSLGPDRAERVGRLLERCAAVKYGGAKPTAWAVREVLDEAGHIVAGLDAGLPGAARRGEVAA